MNRTVLRCPSRRGIMPFVSEVDHGRIDHGSDSMIKSCAGLERVVDAVITDGRVGVDDLVQAANGHAVAGTEVDPNAAVSVHVRPTS